MVYGYDDLIMNTARLRMLPRKAYVFMELIFHWPNPTILNNTIVHNFSVT